MPSCCCTRSPRISTSLRPSSARSWCPPSWPTICSSRPRLNRGYWAKRWWPPAKPAATIASPILRTSMDNLDLIADRIRSNFTAKNAARDNALERSRTLIRHCANAIRAVHRDERPLEAEHLLAAMDDIYSLLVTVDYPDAITGGLRRTTDMVRGVTERTRGDITTSLRQYQLQEALRRYTDSDQK